MLEYLYFGKYKKRAVNIWQRGNRFCSIMDLLAPAAGKTLSSGQCIRITGISPLRGSLRAVSGSTIVILAVIAYMRSCLMVCDGILAQPPLFQKGHRVPHKWLSTRTDVSVLACSVFNVQQRFLKRSLYYIWNHIRCCHKVS